MADDDKFDIEIYGDDDAPEYADTTAPKNANQQGDSGMQTESHADQTAHATGEIQNDTTNAARNDSSAPGAEHGSATQQISSTGGSTDDQMHLHKQAPQQQGVKRKQGDGDERPVDPGATAALMINDLNWWISEEDIRGWANQSGCEDELIEATFNEHKVNGKSKGQAYVQLETPQAATALKHQIEAIYKDQAQGKKPSAIFNPPHLNPFKTLPKDVPARDKNRGDRSSGSYGGPQGNNPGGNFNRFNNRGGFNNRGNQNAGYRNFSAPMGGNMAGGMGGFGGAGAMNNFVPPMGGMNNFGGGFNRGGAMMGGMRGGMNARGGRGGAMGMNPMGGPMNMPMGNNMMGMPGGMMGMGGNMPMMGGGMDDAGAGGFGAGQAHFNPAFFGNNNMGGNDGAWNPHGAKRPRPE
ncbi:hypothetical protein M011DRAFT_494280 [Sporormia fimetaria CBS 119925]|uniref:RRM domain-containing protein n=1 Tax=Sporormia fimetaria CBS 119925 TaxID=1340428 RepID=A0A6A6VAC1_9PLEO|nr:hypothetical protein M011DRAFT_494280 [Sporormia fimetaria CBS 119925]